MLQLHCKQAPEEFGLGQIDTRRQLDRALRSGRPRGPIIANAAAPWSRRPKAPQKLRDCNFIMQAPHLDYDAICRCRNTDAETQYLKFQKYKTKRHKLDTGPTQEPPVSNMRGPQVVQSCKRAGADNRSLLLLHPAHRLLQTLALCSSRWLVVEVSNLSQAHAVVEGLLCLKPQLPEDGAFDLYHVAPLPLSHHYVLGLVHEQF